MDANQCKQFIAGIEAAKIKSYQFTCDTTTNYYNDGETKIAIPDYELNAVVGIRSSHTGGSHNTYQGNIQIMMSDFSDIHEVRTAGDFDQIKTLLDTMGVQLTEDQIKIVINLDTPNNGINPETGNYLRFRYLTQKQYEALSDEEKAKYDSEKKEYEESREKYIGHKMAASITL